MGTALVIFLLLALCGFIAYIGDLLGRRLGKKRLSIFGLRPKHTAILLTIVTGVLIATVTFGAALAAVPGFRRAVTQGERLVRANRALREHNRDLERQGAALSAQIAALSQTNTELVKKNVALTGESAHLTTANSDLKKKNTDLACDKVRLVKESSDLLKRNKALRETNDGLRGKNSRLSVANTRLEANNSRLQADVNKGKKDVMALSRARDELKVETDELKQEDYVVRRNQQIAFRPLPPNPPADQLRTAITNLLYEARHPMGQPKELPLALDTPRKYPGPADDEAAIQEWVVRQAAASRNQRLVVRLIATENAVKGRKIRAALDWYPNKRVFSRGERIAETLVDGGGTIGTVLQDLVYFLNKSVRERALAPPNEMKLREEGLGEMTYDQILEVCEQIRRFKGPARVVARARQDTYQSGPLNVDLEVSPIGSSEAKRH